MGEEGADSAVEMGVEEALSPDAVEDQSQPISSVRSG